MYMSYIFCCLTILGVIIFIGAVIVGFVTWNIYKRETEHEMILRFDPATGTVRPTDHQFRKGES